MLKLTHISFAFLGLAAASLSTVHAAPVHKETLVHDTSTTVEIDLNSETVLCSSADYSALFLKVLIPELAAITLLDHQNFGAGAPCVAAGLCEPGSLPEDIIDPSRPTEVVDIHVQAVRLDVVDAAAQTCETQLIERVHTDIRGFAFVHERRAALGSRPFADCAQNAPATDTPADDPGSVDTAPPAGCNATTGGTSSMVAFSMLGFVAAARRRGAR